MNEGDIVTMVKVALFIKRIVRQTRTGGET